MRSGDRHADASCFAFPVSSCPRRKKIPALLVSVGIFCQLILRFSHSELT